MNKIIFTFALLLLSTKSFAVGDAQGNLNAEEAQVYVNKYANVLTGTECADMVATDGRVNGGSIPGHNSNYVTLHLKSGGNDKRNIPHTLEISTILNTEPHNVTIISFRCEPN